MKLTKFQHACFVVEKDGSVLVVDPGAYSHDFIVPKRVDGIVITHAHPDHLSPELLKRILEKHPKATIIGHESITSQYSENNTLAVTPGQAYSLGAFTLSFFGGQHAPIADGIEVPPNFGVLINSSLYYPGDSFTVPFDADTHQAITVETLALPVSAPWLSFAQSRELLKAIHPKLIFPTHDGILSEDGKQLAENMLGGFASSEGIVYKRLDGASVILS
jgi:L-ascorbate metabolism protein UlaG (beta-lactamase superfamily)